MGEAESELEFRGGIIFAAVSFLCHAGALLTYCTTDMLLAKSGGRCRTSPFDIQRLSFNRENRCTL
jgi:hypothetical protein